MLVGILERYEFQRPGRVAREKGLECVPLEGDRFCSVQLGDTAVLDHQPGAVRAVEQQESLPLAVRLAVGRVLEEAGLEGVSQDGLCVALWRSNASAWRLEHGMRPLTPKALGSHAVLVALHPEGMEAVCEGDGANRSSLALDSAVLAPTSGGYRPVNRGGNPRLVVVVGTPREADTRHREPEQRAVTVEEDSAARRGRGRHMRWSVGRRRWRPGVSPRRGKWKPAGIGPRAGACGRMHAASQNPQPPVPHGVHQDLLLIL